MRHTNTATWTVKPLRPVLGQNHPLPAASRLQNSATTASTDPSQRPRCPAQPARLTQTRTLPDLQDKAHVITGGSAGRHRRRHLRKPPPAQAGADLPHKQRRRAPSKSHRGNKRIQQRPTAHRRPVQIDLEDRAATDRAARKLATDMPPPRRPDPQREPGPGGKFRRDERADEIESPIQVKGARTTSTWPRRS